MGPFIRYFVTMGLALLALGTFSGLSEGQGLAAPFGAIVALLWLGWIVPLFGLPLFVALLWALPRAFRRFATVPREIVGSATGLMVWALAGVSLVGILVAVSTPGPASSPVTPLAVFGSGLAIGTFGALLGLVEARAS